MTVNVLLFASYADALGSSQLQLELPAGATVGDVIRRLAALPGAERLPGSPLVAVDQEYSRYDRALDGAKEVAVIPPVAGG